MKMVCRQVINSSNQVSVIKIETLCAYVFYAAKVVFFKVGFCFFFVAGQTHLVLVHCD